MTKPKKSTDKDRKKKKSPQKNHKPGNIKRKAASKKVRQTAKKSPVWKHHSTAAKKVEQKKYRPPTAKNAGQKRKSAHRSKTKAPVEKKRSNSKMVKAQADKKRVKKPTPGKKKNCERPERTIPDSWRKISGYVPPELEKAAGKVLSRYGLKAESMLLMATKPLKGGAIWQVKTKKGAFSLKLLHRRPARSLFSIGAQEYLVKKKARVPALIPCENNELYVKMGNKLWIVSKWIKPLSPAPKDLKGAKMLSNGLGEFHRISRGYIPPAEAEYASRLSRWPDYYEKMITKFGWFRALAQAYHDTPAGPALLSSLDIFDQQARAALDGLRQSAYADLVARGESHWGFAHQDYGWGNAQLGPGGIWIIDLDGVAFDLPIRDLRKLISNVMKDFKEWDLKWIKEMIKAYHKANPLEPELYKVLLIDLSLPNEFYQFIKEMVYDPETFLNKEVKKELETMVKVDESKQLVITELSAWEVE